MMLILVSEVDSTSTTFALVEVPETFNVEEDDIDQFVVTASLSFPHPEDNDGDEAIGWSEEQVEQVKEFAKSARWAYPYSDVWDGDAQLIDVAAALVGMTRR